MRVEVCCRRASECPACAAGTDIAAHESGYCVRSHLQSAPKDHCGSCGHVEQHCGNECGVNFGERSGSRCCPRRQQHGGAQDQVSDEHEPWREGPASNAPLGEREGCVRGLITQVEQQRLARTRAQLRLEFEFGGSADECSTHRAPETRPPTAAGYATMTEQ